MPEIKRPCRVCGKEIDFVWHYYFGQTCRQCFNLPDHLRWRKLMENKATRDRYLRGLERM